jgi:probable HAF family extracellular repeat protein
MILQRRLRFTVLWAAMLPVQFMANPAHGAVEYRIVALDALPENSQTTALGLNDVGDVVGSSSNGSPHIGESRPVVWNYSGVPTELWSDPNMGGELWDINNSRQVVGRYGSGSGIPVPGPGVPYGRGFVWDGTNGLQDLGLASVGNSMAVAINEVGQVVGTSEVFDTQFGTFIPHAFIWDKDGGIWPIGDLAPGGGSFANAINNLGQVVGYGGLPSGEWGAFVWDETGGFRQLPTIAGGSAQAAAINDNGKIVGGEIGTGGIIWDLHSGSIVSIPVFGRAINNAGQIVGDSIEGPVLWDPLNGLRLLADIIPADSGWELAFPFGIDEDGNIVGYGRFNDRLRGFLITTVPEPSTIVFVMVVFAFAVSNLRVRFFF